MTRESLKQRRLRRRAAIGLLLGAGAIALSAACAIPVPGAAPGGVTNSQPRSGGTLRVGVLGDIQGLDGHLTTGLDYLRRVWDIVTGLDDKLNTVPILAESLELTPDAKQMTLRLRKGIQFHTGREMTSEDVVWNFNRLKDPKVNPIYANLVKPFAAMEAPDYASVFPDFGRIGQIWQADLEKIGVKLTLKPTEPVALTASMQRQQYNGVAVSVCFYGQLHGGVVWPRDTIAGDVRRKSPQRVRNRDGTPAPEGRSRRSRSPAAHRRAEVRHRGDPQPLRREDRAGRGHAPLGRRRYSR